MNQPIISWSVGLNEIGIISGEGIEGRGAIAVERRPMHQRQCLWLQTRQAMQNGTGAGLSADE